MIVQTLYDILENCDFSSEVKVDGKTIDKVVAIYCNDTEEPKIELYTKEKTEQPAS